MVSPPHHDALLVLQESQAICCFYGVDTVICLTVDGFDSIVEVMRVISIRK